MVEAHYPFVTKLEQTFTGLFYGLLLSESCFGEELVGKADDLFFQTDRQHVAMGHWQVLRLDLCKGKSGSCMPLAHQSMAFIAFLPHQFGT